MILISYPYAAPPVRLQERAADGGIRLGLTLRRLDWQGGATPQATYKVVTDPLVGFSEAAAKLLEIAPGVRGQLVGGTVPTILGALADFTSETPADRVAQARAESLAAQTARTTEAVMRMSARNDALLVAMVSAARKLEGCASACAASHLAEVFAPEARRAMVEVAKDLRKAIE